MRLFHEAVAEFRAATASPPPMPPRSVEEPPKSRPDTNNGWFKYPRQEAPTNLHPSGSPAEPSSPLPPNSTASPVTHRSRRRSGVLRPGKELRDPGYRQVVNELIEQGWEYHLPHGRNGKPFVRSPDGVHKYVLAATPSDWRGMRNLRSYLRGLGADV